VLPRRFCHACGKNDIFSRLELRSGVLLAEQTDDKDYGDGDGDKGIGKHGDELGDLVDRLVLRLGPIASHKVASSAWGGEARDEARHSREGMVQGMGGRLCLDLEAWMQKGGGREVLKGGGREGELREPPGWCTATSLRCRAIPSSFLPQGETRNSRKWCVCEGRGAIHVGLFVAGCHLSLPCRLFFHDFSLFLSLPRCARTIVQIHRGSSCACNGNDIIFRDAQLNPEP
jgi:hypothetical protein